MALPELLFLCQRLPFPPDKGEKIRAWHILNYLAQSHRVHLGCLVDDAADRVHVEHLERLCASVGCFPVNPTLQKLRAIAGWRRGRPLTSDVFYNRLLARWVSETLARHPIDRLFVYSSGMVEYAMNSAIQTRILDLVDVDSQKWKAYAAQSFWPMRAVYRREARTLLALERRAAMAFDHTLFVSKSEADVFASLAPECADRLGWLSNGVDLDKFSPMQTFECPFLERGQRIVFTGTMDYWPNVDGVCWFAREVLPRLRHQRSDLHFYIVGAKPNREVMRLARLPAVHVTGRVDDVRPFLAHADVVVAPLRIARGIQNKVLEAMAMGRPVVATAEAFEGLRVKPGRDLLVCTGADDMAQRLDRVLEGQHPDLGRAARLAVEQNHSWSEALRGLDALFAPQRPARQHPSRYSSSHRAAALQAPMTAIEDTDDQRNHSVIR